MMFCPKDRVFRERCNPFDELDEEEFRRRFRLSKAAVTLVLKEVSKTQRKKGVVAVAM